MNYIHRLEMFREKLSKKGLDGFIVSDNKNIRYLSGFSGSSAVLLVTHQKAFFLTDFRYTIQAEKEVENFEMVLYERQKSTLADLIRSEGLKSLGFESQHLSYSQYKEFTDRMKGEEFFPESGLIEEMRVVKEEEEVEFIRKSIAIQCQAFDEFITYIQKGEGEHDIAVELEYRMRKGGSEEIPFSSIVASGCRSAMPHAAPSEKVLMDKDLVVIDYGAKYNGYNSDITRTVAIGEAGETQREIYDIVLLANKEAIQSVKPGVPASTVDSAARDVIVKEGYKDFFGHGTGHGVGLEVHEGPRIRWDSETILKEGMVFTIEPGIYIPDVGGVRIEDMVVVTENGCEVLSHSIPKELKVV